MPDKLENSDQRGWFRRFSYTPPRDIFRGNLTGSLDIEYRFEAEFGKPLAKHIAKIIGRAGLLGREQILAAEELADDCRRKLAQGISAERLIDRLKVRPTRKSIRKQYVRRRGWFIRCLPHFVILSLILYFVWIGWDTTYYYRSHAVVSVDYVALLNDRAMAVPESDRAWPLCREVFIETNLLDIDLPLDVGLSPTHPGWPEVVAFINRHRDSVDQFRRAALMPGLGFSAGYQDDMSDEDARLFKLDDLSVRYEAADDGAMVRAPRQEEFIAVLLSQLGPMRIIGRLLTADAYRSLNLGDIDRFCEALASILGTADHAAEVRFRMCGITGIVIRNQAYHVINDVLLEDSDRLEDEHLLQIYELLDTGSDLRLMSVDDARCFGLDMIQRVYSDDGRGGGHLTPDWFSSASSSVDDVYMYQPGVLPRITASFYLSGGGVNAMPGREELTRWIETAYLQVEESIKVPMWKRNKAERVNEWDDLSRFDEPIQGLILTFIPREYSERWLVDRSDAKRTSLMAGIGLERYRRDHGVWPESLEQLLPKYLTELPIDPFTGKPVFYKIVDRHPLIYSVGADRDDDGGRLPLDSPPGEPGDVRVTLWDVGDQGPIDADWVLYPSRPTLRESGKTAKLPEDVESPYGDSPFGEGFDPFRDGYGATQESDSPSP